MVNLNKTNKRILGLGTKQLGAISLAAMALILPACTGAETEVGEVGENVTTEEVVEETENIIGQEVTIREEVGSQIDEFAFTMGGGDFFGGEDILVLNASGEPTPLPEDIPLQVTGEVAQFVIADIEAEYNLVLDDELYVEYEERPVIIAESIALAPTAETVIEEPELFLGQTVAIEGDVEKIFNSGAFVMNEDEVVGDEGLLVIGVSPQPILEAGAEGTEDYNQVVVTGEVRPFTIAEIERDYDVDLTSIWGADVLAEVETTYVNKPVIVATGVYPSAEEGR